MLSRRQLRIKVLQSLYAYFQGQKNDLAVAERELFRGIEKVYELYIYLLLFLRELADADKLNEGELLQKFNPREEELHAKNRLYKLTFIDRLSDDKLFNQQVTKYRLSWQKEQDLVRKIYLEIKKSDAYAALMKGERFDEKEFLTELIKKYFLQTEAFLHHIEEENIFWPDDLDFMCHIIIRMIRQFYDNSEFVLSPLYKDEEDDKNFVRQLFVKTIVNNPEYEAAISERTRNWEIERIALMDIIILKMALAELVNFPNIPVKVSINEYIDISKEFSTPKSKQFVNGVLDKLALDYKEQGKIVKSGRGLKD